VIEKNYGESVISAIVPIRPSLKDVINVGSWLSKPGAEEVTFILVLDRPNLEINNLIESFLVDFPKVDIVVVKGDFGGPGEARNAGLPFVRSEYLMFWDSDDTPRIPAVLEHLSNKSLTKHTLSIGGFCLQEKSKPDREFLPSNLLEVACNPGLWRVIISTDLVSGLKFKNLRLAEDQIFFIEIFLKAKTIELIPVVFYQYKYGLSGQLTSTNNFDSLCAAVADISSTIRRNKNSDKVRFPLDIFLKQTISLFLNGDWSVKRYAFIAYTKIFVLLPKLIIQETVAVISEMNRKRFK
jgi:hypothetical protein